jgi:hypothetical protein
MLLSKGFRPKFPGEERMQTQTRNIVNNQSFYRNTAYLPYDN